MVSELPAATAPDDRTAFNAGIAEYYRDTEFDYRVAWRLDRAGALHYGWWDETTTSFVDALQRENEVLAGRAGIQPGERVLDAGCGVGGSSVYLARFCDAEVHGITLSPEQADLATARAERAGVGDRARFSVQDYTQTNFADASFDVIWALESVGHARDKDEFIRETWRLLRPGGRLIMADGWATSAEANKQFSMQRLMRGWAGESLDVMGRFAESLGETGFVNVTTEDATKHVVPSIQRLNRLYFLGWAPNRILKALGIRNEVQSRNHETARRQYQAWKEGLIHYGVVYAEKPAG